jgi:hypothetical protein
MSREDPAGLVAGVVWNRFRLGACDLGKRYTSAKIIAAMKSP